MRGAGPAGPTLLTPVPETRPYAGITQVKFSGLRRVWPYSQLGCPELPAFALES